MQWPTLKFVEPLFAVIGAVGLRLYAPERATRDLDIIVAEGKATEAERRLRLEGWEQIADLAVGASSWRSPEDQPLDLFVGDEPWWPKMIQAAQANRDSHGFPILSMPGQVWLKLRAGRTVDAGDLSRLLGLASEQQISEAREFLRANANPEDLVDFESLVRLGRLEFGAKG